MPTIENNPNGAHTTNIFVPLRKFRYRLLRVRPSAHIFVGSKAGWFEISGDLPRFQEMPA